MHQHLEQGNDTLPVVIALVFYHGNSSRYPYSTHLFRLFRRSITGKFFYTQAFQLVDVTAIPDEEFIKHRRVAPMELVMKHIRTRDMPELSQEIAALLNQWVLRLSYLEDWYAIVLNEVILLIQSNFYIRLQRKRMIIGRVWWLLQNRYVDKVNKKVFKKANLKGFKREYKLVNRKWLKKVKNKPPTPPKKRLPI